MRRLFLKCAVLSCLWMICFETGWSQTAPPVGTNSPDRSEIFSNAFLFGFSYHSVVRDRVHQTAEGIYSEVSAEWGPRFLMNGNGQADYERIDGRQVVFHASLVLLY